MNPPGSYPSPATPDDQPMTMPNAKMEKRIGQFNSPSEIIKCETCDNQQSTLTEMVDELTPVYMYDSPADAGSIIFVRAQSDRDRLDRRAAVVLRRNKQTSLICFLLCFHRRTDGSMHKTHRRIKMKGSPPEPQEAGASPRLPTNPEFKLALEPIEVELLCYRHGEDQNLQLQPRIYVDCEEPRTFDAEDQIMILGTVTPASLNALFQDFAELCIPSVSITEADANTETDDRDDMSVVANDGSQRGHPRGRYAPPANTHIRKDPQPPEKRKKHFK